MKGFSITKIGMLRQKSYVNFWRMLREIENKFLFQEIAEDYEILGGLTTLFPHPDP